MAPFIAALLGKGLDLVANAALDKGAEYIEEKTGIKVDMQTAPDATQLAGLRTFQQENEAELAKMRAETDRLSAYLADVQNARDREVKIATADAAPMLNKIITPVLALIVVLGGGLILQINPDAEVKYAVVSIMSIVLSYYFGTSMGSTKANQMMRDLARKG